MTNRIPFYKLDLTADDKKAVMDVLDSGWLTYGKVTEEFEQKFAEYIGAPYCVATNSCTHALFLCIKWVMRDLRTKFIIAVPSLTCSATPHVVRWADQTVEFVDIDLKTLGMLPTSLLSIPVHYAGKYNKQVNVIVEDSAHRILPKSFTGNLACYSFYVTKNITSGEGGMIACATKEQKEWFESARLYGISQGAWRRNVKKAWDFKVNFVGWKCNPNDITSALGLSQLKRIDAMNADRKRIADRYDEIIGEKHDWEANHLYPILINKRDDFIEYMKDKGIQCSMHFPPLHIQPAYSYNKWDLPNTMYAYDHLVTLPLWPYMPDEFITEVGKEVVEWRKKYGRREEE